MAKIQSVSAPALARLLIPYIDEAFGCFTSVWELEAQLCSDGAGGRYLALNGVTALNRVTVQAWHRIGQQHGNVELAQLVITMHASSVPAMRFQVRVTGSTCVDLVGDILELVDQG